jgi:hypothetical protein
MIKNRFRILKLPLNQKFDKKNNLPATTQMARIVQTCFILHNVFLHLNVQVSPGEISADDEIILVAEANVNNADCQGNTIRDAIKQYLYAKNHS